jgi:DMSO/TMAO reductase YedYZ molybdopterin-dependent catalytic subunit
MKPAFMKLVGSGLGAGFVAGLVGGLAMLGIRSFLSAPSLQEVIMERLLLFISAEIFSAILQQVWTMGKILAVISVTFVLAFAGGLIGLAYVAGRQRFVRPMTLPPILMGVALGLALWLLMNLVVLPILGEGFAGSDVPADSDAFQIVLLGGMLAFGITLTWISDDRVWTWRAVAPDASGVSRRVFLTNALGLVVVVVAAGTGLRFLISSGIASMRKFARFHEEPGEMPAEITPVGLFYSVTKNLVDPVVSASSWRLKLEGSMLRPFELTLDELRALPSVEQIVTLECIENRVGGHLISNGLWKGVRLRDLLERAGVQSNVRRIVFRSADGYDESLTLEAAMRPEVLIAYDMNGAPLTNEHGFPARVVVPGRYGMKMPKWLESISTTQDPIYNGYWQKRGWDHEAFVKMTSQIFVPRSLDPVVIGQQSLVGGVAFAGDQGVSRVEFSPDDGKTWHEAVLQQALSPFSWVLWTKEWAFADSDSRTIVVRAYDGKGTQQISAETEAAPAGATGLHKRILYNIKDVAEG